MVNYPLFGSPNICFTAHFRRLWWTNFKGILTTIMHSHKLFGLLAFFQDIMFYYHQPCLVDSGCIHIHTFQWLLGYLTSSTFIKINIHQPFHLKKNDGRMMEDDVSSMGVGGSSAARPTAASQRWWWTPRWPRGPMARRWVRGALGSLEPLAHPGLFFWNLGCWLMRITKH